MEVLDYQRIEKWPKVVGLQPKISLEAVSKPFSQNCQIKAAHDIEALKCWLTHYAAIPNTYKAYYKEAKRFLLWCIYERGLAFGELTIQDMEQYVDFLKNPPIHWYQLIPGAAKEQNKLELPFKGPLSETAARMSLKIINSLLNYLVKADYLRTNPIKLLPRSFSKDLERDLQKYKVWERMLEVDEWEAVQRILTDMPANTLQEIDNKMRTQFLFALLYLLGLRIHEVALSSWNAFRKHQGSWWFFIKGKGGKLGHIPINDQLLAYVKAYRLHLGLSPLPTLEESGHLLVSRKSKRPLKVRQLYNLVKAISVRAAKLFAEQPLKQQKLEKLSPHWLRHLSASHQDKAGIPATQIQANHRHSFSQTTQIYLHAEDALRAEEMQKLKMNIAPKLITQASLPKKYELQIKLKGQAVSERLNLSRLLDSLENNVFKTYALAKKEQEKEALLNQFDYLKKFGFSLEFSYYFGVLEDFLLEKLKEQVLREAAVRLFECKVEWKIVS